MPSTWAFTIGGSDKKATVAKRSLQVSMSRGTRGVLSALIWDKASDATAYRPVLDQEVLLTIDGTDRFRGFITDVSDKPLGGMRSGTGTDIKVGSYEMVCDRVTVTHTFAAGGTLKDAVQWIVTNILGPDFSVTLDAGMLTWGTLEEQIFKKATVTDVFNHFTDVTGWIWRISAAKVLYFFAPGTSAASFNLDPTNCRTPVPWQQSRQQYANRLLMTCGDGSKQSKSQNFTDPGTAAATFTVDYPASQDINDPWPNLLIVDGAVVGVVGWGAGSLPSPAYYWDYVNHALVREAGAATYSGHTVTVAYTAQYPFDLVVQDAVDIAAKGPWELPVTATTIFDIAAATQTGNGIIARLKQAPRKLQAGTQAGLALPGDHLTLSFSHRTVTGTWLVESVQFKLWNPGTFYYEYVFAEGTTTQRTPAEYLKDITKGGGVTSTGAIISGGGGTVTNPVLSSPFNLGGSDRTWEALSPAAWVDVPNAHPFVATASFTGQLRGQALVRLLGPGVTMRLYDLTASVAAITAAKVTPGTAKTRAEGTAIGAITIGHRYVMQMLSDTNGADVTALGDLESL